MGRTIAQMVLIKQAFNIINASERDLRLVWDG